MYNSMYELTVFEFSNIIYIYIYIYIYNADNFSLGLRSFLKNSRTLNKIILLL